MPDVSAEPRRRTARWADPAPLAVARRAQCGLDFFRAIAAGTLPQPPIYDLLGFRLVAADPGLARFEGGTGEHLLNPFGTVHGGYAATLLDSACGVGLQSTLPQGRGVATVRLEISYLRPILPAMGRVTCVSKLVDVSDQVAWSEADVLGPDGKLLARGRGCFAVFATEAGPWNGEARPDVPAPVYESREIAWDDPAILQAAARRMTGFEFIAAQADGRLPLPSIHKSVNYDPVLAERGRAVYRCKPETCHYNPMGGVHGGLAAILVDTATGAAIQSVQEKGRGGTAVTLAVDYFRPITRDTGELFAEGRLVRAGSRIGIADAEVKDAKGTVYARGSATYLSFALNGGDA
ncbi:MAG: PaaI family thioesterase [Alphaproteobacteria bacterium]